MQILVYILAALPFYLLGSLPTGYLLAKRAGIDISKEGSGNVGATNVSRILGKKAGITTLAIDTAKGALAVIFAGYILGDATFGAVASFAVVCGHCFSIPGKLKGGKGVATALGVTLAINPVTGILALIFFAVVFYLSKIVSLASVGATLAVPAVAMLLEVEGPYQVALALIALLITYRHKANLIRITRGEEPRYSFTTSKASGPM